MAQSISDEELQLKKRARRRLVGAVALVLLAVIFLPMVLDKEPKPVGQDIAIRIPSQEGTPFHPQDAVPPVAPKASQALPAKAAESKPVESAPVSQSAEKPLPATPQPANTAAAQTDVKPDAAPSRPATQQKPAVPSAEKNKAAKSEPAEKPVKHEANAKSQGYVIQLGAFANMDNAKQRQAKLNALGIHFYTEKIKTAGGEKLRVRAGPYATREEAEKVQARLKAQGIADGVVAEKGN